ncbi:hypothetical protein NDU88_005705 [Pleurodeles waltl]|uniref:Uncharacterized protein n=1 Tax=Pleurodeles waltl TaxID=8319 RepID=A0AAV7ULU5_PLEWA|nr:hypothetical protein NDU88_005705 [Pleurodeles waltl]
MALAGASRPALPGVRGKKPRRPGSAGGLFQASGFGSQAVAVRGSLWIPSAGVAVGAQEVNSGYSRSRSRRGVLPEVFVLHKSSRGRRVQSCKSHASGGKRSGLEVASLETKLQSLVNRAAVLGSFLVLLEQGSPLRIQRSLVLGKASLEQFLQKGGDRPVELGPKQLMSPSSLQGFSAQQSSSS